MPNLNDANQAAVPNSSDAQQLLMRDGGLLDQTHQELLREGSGEHDLARAFLAVIEAAAR